MTASTRIIAGAALALAVALPLAALAQADDVAYCKALSDKYKRYVSNDDAGRRSRTPNVTADTAMARCPTDAAGSIPVLEKALKDALLDLPPRG